jgi:N-acetyl-anhydromuramyl-L-alanine amidase AmpD
MTGALVALCILLATFATPLSIGPPSVDYPGAQWAPADSSNYTVSDREANGLRIKWVVIHDIEGTEASCINWFQNPAAKASSHYVIGYDGTVYQMVAEKDIAWHAGNWDYNQHSIGIEHAGFADNNYFTDAEYRASAKLVAFLIRRYNITLIRPSGIAPANSEDGSGVIGHDQVPDPGDPQLSGGAGHHYDPGRYWNWTYYMSLVKAYYDETQELPPKRDEGLLDPLLSLPPILVAVLVFVFLILAGVIAFIIRRTVRAGHHLVRSPLRLRVKSAQDLKPNASTG